MRANLSYLNSLEERKALKSIARLSCAIQKSTIPNSTKHKFTTENLTQLYKSANPTSLCHKPPSNIEIANPTSPYQISNIDILLGELNLKIPKYIEEELRDRFPFFPDNMKDKVRAQIDQLLREYHNATPENLYITLNPTKVFDRYKPQIPQKEIRMSSESKIYIWLSLIHI